MEEYDYQRRIFKRKICSFEQLDGEMFHEAWERFKQLVLEDPHHPYTQEALNLIFYDGLMFDF